MQITVAKSAGFCFGVKRAVDTLFQLLESDYQGKVYTVGQLIHNPRIIQMLQERGVCAVSEREALSLLEDGEEPITFVVRAHGLVREIYEKLDEHSKTRDNITLVDCTCPDVKKIHNIIIQHTNPENLLIMFGDPNHPEVVAAVSYATGQGVVAQNAEQLPLSEKIGSKEVIIVAQTTQNIDDWKKFKEICEKLYTNTKIFDTICKATHVRQTQTAELAAESDLMLVIGGRNSANTHQLYKVAAEVCGHTYMLEESAELLDILQKTNLNIKKVGITAGASTPAVVIQEVVKTMNENINPNTENQGMENFEEMLNQTFKTLTTGDIVTGTITSVSNNEIHVDLSNKATGIIMFDEIAESSTDKLTELYKPGQEIKAQIVRLSDLDGMATLSVKRLLRNSNQKKMEEAFESGEILEGRVTEIIRGGIIVTSSYVKVFVPASQSGVRMGEDISVLRNTTVKFKIIEYSDQKKRAVGSIRAAATEARRAASDAIWATITEGQKITGIVKSLVGYGAFIDIGGIDGMVHNSELSWKKIGHPSQVIEVGQTLEVYVKSLDRENGRISLGHKDANSDPWKLFTDQYNSFDTAQVKIVSITPFGAFAEIIPGVDGLIHISQISAEKVTKVDDVLSIGQEVTVLITEIDLANRRISLSISALIQQDEEQYGGEDGPNIINLDNIGEIEVNATAADAFPREDFEEKVAEEEVPVTFSPQTETNPEAASATVLETEE